MKISCKLLKVSYSGFYDWLKRKPSQREPRDCQLKESIVGDSKETYRFPRIQKKLERVGKELEKSWKRQNSETNERRRLIAKRKRTFRPKITSNNPSMKKIPQVFKYIDWYNRNRIHSSLGYMSPIESVESNQLIA